MEKMLIGIVGLIIILGAIYSKNMGPMSKNDSIIFWICIGLGTITLIGIFIVMFNRKLFWIY